MKKTILLLLFSATLFAQTQDVVFGNAGINPQQKASIYDISDPKSVSMKVSVWGAVRNPGYYIIPDNTDFATLFSMAGGPTEESKLESIRIFRPGKDTSQAQIFFANYEDLLWGKDLKTLKAAPKLLPGDMVIIPIEPKFFLKDYLSLGLTSAATIFAILNLIVQLQR
jgi:polysaccharide biosynthesis/export protein